jgi:hypothetical protein
MTCSGFNLPNFVDIAFKQLHSDVQLEADIQIGMCPPISAFDGNAEPKVVGDYKTKLHYTQSAVPTKTDETLNLLLPILARPIVQKIVSGSALG